MEIATCLVWAMQGKFVVDRRDSVCFQRGARRASVVYVGIVVRGMEVSNLSLDGWHELSTWISNNQ